MSRENQSGKSKERASWRAWWDRAAAKTEVLDPEKEQQLMRGRRYVYPTPGYKFCFGNTSQKLQMTLDVGCGLGATIDWMHGGAKTVIGVDFSFNMLKLTQCKLKQKGVKIVLLVVADATALPFADASFDRLTCMGVLQMINRPDTIQVFKESYRVTKDGAANIFTIRNRLSPYAFTRSIALKLALLIRKTKEVYLHYNSYRWYRQQLTELGGEILTEHSFGLEPFLAPSFLISLIRILEVAIAKKTTILRPFGVTYVFEVKRAMSHQQRLRLEYNDL
jgi:ubiquinone/menaquinone biosynthesis C-methylase UbiE